MLGPRIASAAVLIPAVLFLLWAGPETTALTTAVAAIIGVYEFFSMAQRAPQQYHPFVWPGYLAAPAFSLAGYWRSPWLMAVIVLVIIGLAGLGTFLEKAPAEQRPMNWLLGFFWADLRRIAARPGQLYSDRPTRTTRRSGG